MSSPSRPNPSDGESRGTFFRQGGWMVMATVAAGFFMVAVHVVINRRMAPEEYAVFFTLLRIFLLMSIPSAGLQVVFAQQAAAAVTDERRRQLAATARGVLAGTFVLWLVMALAAIVFYAQLLEALKIRNPAGLWATILIGLLSLWAPVFKGLIQGEQRFMELGWVQILDGAGRFTAIVVIVWLGGQAAGGMIGALIGQVASAALAAWWLRGLFAAPGEGFAWAPWLRRVVPLTLGIGSIAFMCNADVVFVQGVFAKEQTPLYMPAAMIGLGLVTFTTPLMAVMFPKVARGAALSSESRSWMLALVATALLGAGVALVCTVAPGLPLRIIYFANPAYWASWPLVPWFTWGLLPLILANVLVGNLLARERFAIVPWVAAIAVGYWLCLQWQRPRLLEMDSLDAFRRVVQTLGLFSLAQLAAGFVFTWRETGRSVTANSPETGH